MTHLNQMLAIAKGTKARSEAALTQAYHKIQRAEPWSGIVRSYRPKNEDGDRYTGESKHVQTRAQGVVDDVYDDLVRMLDVQATVDAANQGAVGTVTVDGTVVARDVPVATLLFLKKHLTDLQTFFSKLPTLDIADKWTWDAATDAYRSETVETTKTKKLPRNHVLAEATDRHPAQVQVYTEDVVEGYWETTKYSGAWPATKVKRILHRIQLLLDAVKEAIQEANEYEVVDQNLGGNVLSFILNE